MRMLTAKVFIGNLRQKMSKSFRYVFLITVVLLFTAIVIANKSKFFAETVSGNDNFANAYPVTVLNTVYIGNNTGFTTESGEYLPNNVVSTAWVAVTLDGPYVIEICTSANSYASLFWPGIGFSQGNYSGPSSPAHCPSSYMWSFSYYPEDPPKTYYFQIGTVSGYDGGEYQVKFTELAPPPTLCESSSFCGGTVYEIDGGDGYTYQTDDPDCASASVCEYTYGPSESGELSYCGADDGCDCWWQMPACDADRSVGEGTPTPTPSPTPTPPLCSLHRDGQTWCNGHGGIAMTIPYDISYNYGSNPTGWAQCLAWCDANMNSTTLPLCQFNNDGPRNCWINRAPGYINDSSYGNINNCNWQTGPNPYGAWDLSFVSQGCTTPTPSTTPTPTSTPTPSPTQAPINYQIYNLDGTLKASAMSEVPSSGAWGVGNPIQVGDAYASQSSDQITAILDASTRDPLAILHVDMSANRDWQNLILTSSNDLGKLYLNTANGSGISTLNGSLGTADLYLKRTAGVNAHLLSDDQTLNYEVWGKSVSIDELNNIVMTTSSSDGNVYAYIWNNPSNFSSDSYDYKLILNTNYPSGSYTNYYPSIQKLGGGKFLATWKSQQSSPYNIVLLGRIFDASGNFLSSEIVLSSNNNNYRYDPKSSNVVNGKVMIVWYDTQGADDSSGGDWAKAQLLDTSGNKIGSPFYVNNVAEAVDEPDVAALPNGRFVFTYYDGNEEQVYYRIWDPNTSDFTSAPVKIDIGTNDFAGFYQSIAVDDEGGFAVFFGGYFDDGDNYYDRVYLQIFDANQNPVYSSAEDMKISDDNYTQWYSDNLGIAYGGGTFQLSWDNYLQDGNDKYFGIAYRRVMPDGTKYPTAQLSETWTSSNLSYYDNNSLYEASIDVDKNGIPVLVWEMRSNFNKYQVYGTWGVIPESVPNRVGFCPNATSLGNTNDGCSGIVYKTVGDEELSMGFPLNGIIKLKLSDINKGGAFVDVPPALAFTDFNPEGITDGILPISWNGISQLANGTVSFYYDTDNIGFNGTLISGGITAASGQQSSSLDLSDLNAGTYWIYAKVDDGYYNPYYIYAPKPVTLVSTEKFNIFMPDGFTARLASNTSVDLSIDKVNGTKLISIFKTGLELLPIADISVTFDGNIDWSLSDLSGNSDQIQQKAFVHSLIGLTGAASTYALYIPIKPGFSSNSVVICPGADSFEEITLSCSGVQLLHQGDSGVSQVYYNGNMYWKVSGLIGTGGLAQDYALNVKDNLTRLKAGVASDHTIVFGTLNGLTSSTNKIEINMADWNISSLTISDLSLTSDNVPLNLGATHTTDTWGVGFNSGVITLTAPTGGTGYIEAGSNIVLKIGKITGGTNQPLNPADIGAYNVTITNTTPEGLEEGLTTIPIVDSDQVNITGYVKAYISFDIDTGTGEVPGIDAVVDCNSDTCKIHGGDGAAAGANYTVDLGELKSTAINKSNDVGVMHSDGISGIINSIYLDLSTNAAFGVEVTVASASNYGLQGPGESHILPVTDGDNIDTNSGLYGFNFPVQSYLLQGTIVTNSDCSSDSAYCGPTTNPKIIFTSDGLPIDGGRVRVDIAAAAGYTNTPGEYTDTLTFVATATF